MKHEFTIPKIWLSTTYAMINSDCKISPGFQDVVDFLQEILKQKGKEITFEIDDSMYLKLLSLFEEVTISNVEEASLRLTESKLKSHTAITLWKLYWDTKHSTLKDIKIPDFLPENL